MKILKRGIWLAICLTVLLIAFYIYELRSRDILYNKYITENKCVFTIAPNGIGGRSKSGQIMKCENRYYQYRPTLFGN